MQIQATGNGLFPYETNLLKNIFVIGKAVNEIYVKRTQNFNLSNMQIKDIAQGVLVDNKTTKKTLDELVETKVFNMLRQLKLSIWNEVNPDACSDSLLRKATIAQLVEGCQKIDKMKPSIEAKIKDAIRTLQK